MIAGLSIGFLALPAVGADVPGLTGIVLTAPDSLGGISIGASGGPDSAGIRPTIVSNSDNDSIRWEILDKGIARIVGHAEIKGKVKTTPIGRPATDAGKIDSTGLFGQGPTSVSFAPDSGVVYIEPLGVKNGTVRVVGISKLNGIPSAPITITVSGQPTPPTVVADAGRTWDSLNVDTRRTADSGFVSLSWTAGEPGASLGSLSEYLVGFAPRRWTQARQDSVEYNYTGTIANQVIWTAVGNVTSAILPKVKPNEDTLVFVRGLYENGVGPIGSAKVTVPATLQGIDARVTYPSGSVTFNGKGQVLGGAFVNNSSGLPGLANDPWKFAYSFRGTAGNILPVDANGDVQPGVTTRTESDTAALEDLKFKPVNAGTYTATVWIYNSKYRGRQEATFKIDRAGITSDFIKTAPPANAFMYDNQKHRMPFWVEDPNLGNVGLTENKDWRGAYEGTIAIAATDSSYFDNVDAGEGTAKIRIVGMGNYTGTAVSTYSIAKRPISIDTARSVIKAKIYNGDTDCPPESITVAFDIDGRGAAPNTGLVGVANNANTLPGFVRDSAFVIENAAYVDENVYGVGNRVTARISLVADGRLSKNYTLLDANFVKNSQLLQKTPTKDDLTFEIPTDHFYNGPTEDRGIGDVTWALDGNEDRNEIVVLYKLGSGRDTTALPRAAGTYAVSAQIKTSTGANYRATGATNITLGNYIIAPPARPVYARNLAASATYAIRAGRDTTLVVSATSPNGGVITYQWYKAGVAIAGATDSFLVVSSERTDPTSSTKYLVWATNTVDGVQIPDSLRSNEVTVSVLEPALDIAGASVAVTNGPFTYTGNAMSPKIEVKMTINDKSTNLVVGTDYTIGAFDAVNAGDVLVTITGIGKYEGTANGSFVINKKSLLRTDFTYTTTKAYNAESQEVTITPVSPRKGIGQETVTYGDLPLGTLPINAGTWKVSATFAEGDNFLANDTTGFELGQFTITQKTPAATDFLVNGVAFTPASIPVGHVFNGSAQGIGAVTIKGTGEGSLTVKYGGTVGAPTAAGTYAVTVDVAGGTNYRKGTVTLGNYTITSVEAVVAAVKSLVETATYGPVKQADVNTAAAAKAHVEDVISKLNLNGVDASVREISFTQATTGTPTQPGGVAGKFEFKVDLTRGTVVDSSALRTLSIAATPVSIASNDRVIPGSKGEQAIVAPVIKLVGEFTVGPNPVAKAAGKVAFFWQGKSVSKGTLFVFDASGNLVKKIGTADVKGLGTDRREIGSWNLADAKGRPIAEGTYLVKGVLTVGGEKVKVSSILGVR